MSLCGVLIRRTDLARVAQPSLILAQFAVDHREVDPHGDVELCDLWLQIQLSRVPGRHVVAHELSELVHPSIQARDAGGVQQCLRGRTGPVRELARCQAYEIWC